MPIPILSIALYYPTRLQFEPKGGRGTCELRMVLAIDRMKGPEWGVLKSDIRNPDVL